MTTRIDLTTALQEGRLTIAENGGTVVMFGTKEAADTAVREAPKHHHVRLATLEDIAEPFPLEGGYVALTPAGLGIRFAGELIEDCRMSAAGL